MRTLEIRWFLQDEPDFASAIFRDPAADVATRTDWYARPADERTGTKFREGRLETKLRLREAGELKTGGAAGMLEEWEKWSVPLEPDRVPLAELFESCGWIGVEKTRALRVYKSTEPGIAEVPDWRESRPASAVQFEVTKLGVKGAMWWTVGFEAFGPGGDLESVVNHVLGGLEGAGVLQASRSFAYPRWLQIVAGE